MAKPDKNFVFCIYGFLRDMKPYNADVDGVHKFVYVPKTRYEDKDVEVTQEELDSRFGKEYVSDVYQYDPSFYNTEAKKLEVPKFNRSHQQPQRILSFFNHIKKSLELFENSTQDYNDETIIFLFRSDIGIREYDVELARKLLDADGDIIVEKLSFNGIRDMFFVFKKKDIFVFKTLYESYKEYVVNYHNGVEPKPRNDVPEAMIDFHIKHLNKKVVPERGVFNFTWDHVCNKYCGRHNKDNLKILGED
tara:strand:+ start:241 stop:987 length:747 start_codon:yes stop_codon:yes gene_type:complete